MTALVRLGLRLAGVGAARERLRSVSVAVAAGAGTWAILATLAVAGGVADVLGSSYQSRELLILRGSVLLSVSVPVVVLVATAARLSASMRDRRLACLRLIGLPPGSTRLVAAVEVGVATLVGAVAGALVSWPTVRLLPAVEVGATTVRPAGSAPGPLTAAVVVALVLAVSVALAQAPVRRRPTVSGARSAQVRPVPVWRVVPVLVGVLLLVLARSSLRASNEVSDTEVTLLFSGAALTGLGTLVLLPAVMRLVAGGLCRLRVWPALMLAGRRIQAQPAGVHRVIAGLLAALFVVAGARMVLVAFESTPQYQNARSALDSGAQQLQVFLPRDNPDAEATLRADPLVDRVADDSASVQSGCGPPQGPCLRAFVGTCAELREAVPSVRGCRDNQPAWLGDPTIWLDGSEVTWRGSSGRGDRLTLALPTATLPVVGVEETAVAYENLTDVQVFLPASTPGVGALQTDQGESWTVSAPGGADAAADLQQRLRQDVARARVFPTWDPAEATFVDSMRRGLWLLASVVVSIGLLSFVVGGIDRAVSRRAESARLQVLGTPRRTIVAAQWVEGLLPLLVGVPLAVGLGSFAGTTYLAVGESSLGTPWDGVLAVTGLTLLGSVLVAGLTVLAAAPRLRADLIRAA